MADKKLICESKFGKIYLDGSKYLVEKLSRTGAVVDSTACNVKDDPLLPYNCYKNFGYKIVDMPYVSDLYDKYVKDKNLKTAYDKLKEKK